MIGAFLTSIFFAANAVCARRTALHYGGTAGNLLRLLAASAMLWAWAHLLGVGEGGGAFGWFLLSGALGFGIGGLAMFHALPLIGSNLSMLIVQCGSAVAAALVEWLWLGTRLSAAQALLAALTMAGIVFGLGAGPRSTAAPSRASSPRFALGAWLAILSACSQGVGAVIARRGFAAVRASGLHIDAASSAYQRTIGGLAIAILAWLVAGGWRASTRRLSPAEAAAPAEALPPWAWVALNAVLGPVLGVTLYQWALRSTPAAIVLPIVSLAPLLTVPMARALERAWPARRFWIGAALAVAGAAGLAIAK